MLEIWPGLVAMVGSLPKALWLCVAVTLAKAGDQAQMGNLAFRELQKVTTSFSSPLSAYF